MPYPRRERNWLQPLRQNPQWLKPSSIGAQDGIAEALPSPETPSFDSSDTPRTIATASVCHGMQEVLSCVHR